MIAEFKGLSSEETENMLKAPILICLLIAGADGTIDQSEIQKAISIATQKRYKAKDTLKSYYKEVGLDFEDKLKIIMASYPIDSEHRNQLIINELKLLNTILIKLDNDFAIDIHHSFQEIAKAIAESSGGLLGFNKVDAAEAELIELPMINKP